MQTISTSLAPQAIGPYSQAIKVGNIIFCSGQIGLNPETMTIVEGGIETETHQVCKNIGEVLKEAGVEYENVVKTTIFLQSLNDFAIVNEIYGQYFPHKPARSTVEVAKLPKGALVEIEVLAVL
ncbi:MAG: RidA family protein [Candidatus Gracilibacteria bacterium]|nr:RidA family protein [Candidatus Gracilibacteria bacterium]